MNITDHARTRHVYIAGKSQSGKSTLIHWMALQDIAQDKGVCVIDPHGDLVTKLLHHIPKSRTEDVIYLDATAPVPLDFMGWDGDEERDRLADDLMVMFKQFFSNTAGDRWQSVLHWTVNTLLAAKGCTFLDIYYFLVSERVREKILQRANVPEILQYWAEQFPYLPKDAATPITTRMSKFLLTPSLKAILGSANPRLNVYDLMQQRKVLLVNLANVGQESGNLLGTLIVSKIQQAAMRRQRVPKSERIPFYLYVDEFQHFQTSAFDVILSEAGKYKLCLTLAHQFVSQLDPRIRDSIMGNVSTFILFRLNEKDALSFKGELGKYSDDTYWHQLLTTLPTGEAIYRAVDGSVQLIHTPRPPAPSKATYAQIIRKRTVEKYACELETPVFELKDDEVEPSTGPPKDIPSHRRKAKSHKAPG
jgi:hypothetical protein